MFRAHTLLENTYRREVRERSKHSKYWIIAPKLRDAAKINRDGPADPIIAAGDRHFSLPRASFPPGQPPLKTHTRISVFVRFIFGAFF